MIGAWLGLALCVAQPQTPSDILQRAQQLFDDLEYEKVPKLVKTLTRRTDVDVESRLKAYVLMGSAFAVLDRGTDAEQAFRLLLRAAPDFELPADTTAPKVLRVFRSVRSVEERIRKEAQAIAKQRLVASLALSGGPAPEAKGGVPLAFRYKLVDPGQAVDGISVRYRRQTTGDFSALALERLKPGEWLGELPGEWTANEDGFVLEYWVSTLGSQGEPLLQLNAPPSPPLTLSVQPGEVVDNRPVYRKGWFWAAIGVVVAGAVATTAALYATRTKLPRTPVDPVQL